MDGGRGLKAEESVRMTLLDHIILADEQYYSFRQPIGTTKTPSFGRL